MPRCSYVVGAASEALSIKYNNLVYELQQAGKRVTVLSLGESFFELPLWPMDDLPFPALFHYSHSRGVPELRQVVADYYCRQYRVPVDAERELLITCGSKAAIYLALLSTLNPDNEVLIHEPAWVSYPEQVRLCGGVPVAVPYQATVFDYEKYLTERSKLIVLNNPHNPTGRVFSPAELRYVVDLARANDLFVLADEAYSDFPADGSFVSLGTLDPRKEHVLVVNSLSKNLGMSGWRLGYLIANGNLTSQVLKANQHIITCPATILEHYVARHFHDILAVTRPQMAALADKRRRVARVLDQLGLTYLPGEATFYFFVSLAPSALSSDEFCTRLLQEEYICTVPGSGYGKSCQRFIRVSIGTESFEAIAAALERIRAMIHHTSRTAAA
jgi:aspartate aminotransferase/aminotransferase